ncbi:MAG: hypothetical protein P4L40_02795 [Terracidiphilus sp.]|nr:hypothetical protein [Terracidiphilus sp.]
MSTAATTVTPLDPAVPAAVSLPAVPDAAPNFVTDSANRVRAAVEDVLAVVRAYQARGSDYFAEQLDRGTAVVEEVRHFTPHARSVLSGRGEARHPCPGPCVSEWLVCACVRSSRPPPLPRAPPCPSLA